MTKELQAAYEVKRQGFLTGFLQSPANFEPALAYAHQKRLAPYFHEHGMKETHGGDPFDAVYAVDNSFIDSLMAYVDQNWRAGTLANVEFYNLESLFGGMGSRIAILHTLEYARIAGRYSDPLYDAVTSNAPIECQTIDATFAPSDVRFS
ncbi:MULTISPECIES: hypothetical protein [unclassified Shinella]|uniref:hypothetical protein n=1 Tax=unclassified Shinella TaxID=2643062 RepID=UPI00234EBB66|nr:MULTISPECIES: hypothetical protein [unclassified Shinella]MCO5153398.1 hypothetical protein [Shinella sp.]MDC7260577.1 hypothetical protein [Shinella sp. HY16]MDC7267472.1 hypothetical protein [Shinella sp. YZ44]